MSVLRMLPLFNKGLRIAGATLLCAWQLHAESPKKMPDFTLPDLDGKSCSSKQLTGKVVDASQTIIINFFYKEPVKNQAPCIDHYTADKKYLRFTRKHKEYVQFFITEKGFNYDQKTVYEDVEETISKLLFNDIVHCGNYIIIKPNGHYYKKVGEYRQDDNPSKIKEDW